MSEVNFKTFIENFEVACRRAGYVQCKTDIYLYLDELINRLENTDYQTILREVRSHVANLNVKPED